MLNLTEHEYSITGYFQQDDGIVIRFICCDIHELMAKDSVHEHVCGMQHMIT